MRNGISPVALSGGVAGNVIPAEAKAMLNVRTIPGHKIEDVAERIAAVVLDSAITVAIESHGKEAPGSDPDSAMFRAISSAAYSHSIAPTHRAAMNRAAATPRSP